METIEGSRIQRGDKIVLKTEFGPEGGINNGIVEEVREKGVLADFGLKYSYIIPFNAINSHLTLIQKKTGEIKKVKEKANSKNLLKL